MWVLQTWIIAQGVAIVMTYIDNPDALIVLQEFQAHRYIFQFLCSEVQSSVELRKLLPQQNFQQHDQAQSIRKTVLKIVEMLVVYGLEMLVGPSRKCVFLDKLPLRILSSLS